jgi:hypothetical protein
MCFVCSFVHTYQQNSNSNTDKISPKITQKSHNKGSGTLKKVIEFVCVKNYVIKNYTQRYKDRIRAELNKHLRAEFDKRTSAELTKAVPPTETLNSEAAKEKAGLARQGSLAERQPPASLITKRTQFNTSIDHDSDIPVHDFHPDDVMAADVSFKKHTKIQGY